VIEDIVENLVFGKERFSDFHSNRISILRSKYHGRAVATNHFLQFRCQNRDCAREGVK
jgi:hypothetical protein